MRRRSAQFDFRCVLNERLVHSPTVRTSYKMLRSLVLLVPLTLAAADPDAVILDMMTNIHENGFNGRDGLWINFRYGSRPLQTNFKGNGETDGPGDKFRHDPLTDLRYLHNLLLYKHLHPQDARFDADLSRFREIVRAEFEGSKNERGWIYDEMIDMYRLSHDDLYRNIARGLVEAYAAGVKRGPAPVNYKKNANHPNGYYRVDNMLQQGAALIQASREFARPEWETTGRKMIDFIYRHAWFEPYHCFAITMDDLLTPDGKINPNETIYRDHHGRYLVDGGVVRLGGLGQMATSLLHVYMATRDQVFLDRATELLDALAPEQNSLGLWDKKNLGYFNGVVFPGKARPSRVTRVCPASRRKADARRICWKPPRSQTNSLISVIANWRRTC